MQTQTRRRLLIWTLFSATWKLMMKNEKTESLRASELNHLSRIFFERMAQEKWRRVRASNSFQFSAQYTAIVFNILKNNEFEKSRKVLAAKRKSVVQEHGIKETNRKLLRQSITWDQALFSFRFVKWHSSGQGETVAVRENVWEPLKLGLISG